MEETRDNPLTAESEAEPSGSEPEDGLPDASSDRLAIDSGLSQAGSGSSPIGEPTAPLKPSVMPTAIGGAGSQGGASAMEPELGASGTAGMNVGGSDVAEPGLPTKDADSGQPCDEACATTTTGSCECSEVVVDAGSEDSGWGPMCERMENEGWRERCRELGEILTNRYSFDGDGSDVWDGRGEAHGTAVGTSLAGDGTLALNGDDAYVELPSGLVSDYDELTLEFWLVWKGGKEDQHLFDFGDPSPEGNLPVTYLWLTPKRDDADGVSLGIETEGNERQVMESEVSMPKDELVHLTLTLTGTNARVYLGQELHASMELDQNLREIGRSVSWLGRAINPSHPFLRASLYEFRVAKRAFSAEDVALSETLGPDWGL